MSRLPVPTMPAPPVAVVGLGQLGGSLAAALVGAGREVTGWDIDPAAREAAAARGVRIGRELSGVVVLATPIPALAGALDALSVDPDATVTDLGSVKAPVLGALGERFGSRFVGGHPMCGTERSGHAATDPELFRGARWAVCLEPGTELPRWLRVAELALAVGAEVVPVTAAEHDDAVAAISHVPHLLAAALAAAAADAGPLALGLAAGSFASGTRVIDSDPAFVTAMVQGNAGPTAAALAAVQAQLERPWPELVAAGHTVLATPAGRRTVRVPLDRAALLALGRAGGAVSRRLAAFVEGWVPEPGAAVADGVAGPRGRAGSDTDRAAAAAAQGQSTQDRSDSMDEKDILGRIHELVEEEHQLRSSEAEHGDEQRARVAELERHLDQAWDLLRQRRAKRQYGEDPESAGERPEPQVESYLQ